MGRKATRSAEEIAKAKRDMFIRTAEKRVGRILDGLDMLECLSTRYSGYYTEEQVNAMFNAIRKKVDEAEKSFRTNGKTKLFSFSDESTSCGEFNLEAGERIGAI